MTRLTAREVSDKIGSVHGDRYTLVRETYVSTKVKAWFYDTKKQEWFYTSPAYVMQGCGNPSDRADLIRIANTPRLQEMGQKRAKWVSSSGEVLSQVCKQYGATLGVYSKLAKQTSTDFAIKALMSKIVEGKYTKYQSNLEIFTIDLLKDSIPSVQKWNKKPLEYGTITHHPDFRLEQGRTVYLDVHGLFFHSEYHVDREYHQRRAQDFKTKSLPYLQFYADEVYEKPEIVKSMVLCRLGNTKNKYAARKLEIRSVSSTAAQKFLKANHLMGVGPSARYIGLFQGEDLVVAMSFKICKDKVEISRFCTLLNSSCAGGFGKLVSHLKQFDLPIHSFCDLRYSDGHSYKAVGFLEAGETLGWNWTDGSKRFNRLMCKAGNGKTEKENAKERGWFKIYDAGQRKYVLAVPSQQTPPSSTPTSIPV